VDSERWQRAKELFGSARDHEPAERSAFLEQACGGDEELRQEIEALLAAPSSRGKPIMSTSISLAVSCWLLANEPYR
jgi:eukaryotic-like serine/threonine-protein kinase